MKGARMRLVEGAIGTRLMAAGVRPGPEMDLVARRRPALLSRLHRTSRAAGADALKTHTFALTGSGAEARDLIRAAVDLARGEAGRGGRVLGSLGPLPGLERRAEWLAEAGVDALLLETFLRPGHLAGMVRALRPMKMPILALLAAGTAADLRRVADSGADAVGLNCLLPSEAEAALRHLRDLPLAALPGAGLPGRLRPVSAWADGAARLAALGLRWLGGCCGTGPAHLKALKRRLRPGKIQGP
jgi:methionine synthase I (cobalamin-dependent)